MSECVVDLFVEDRAHEELLKALLLRLAREDGKRLVVRTRSARGGHGRALSEFDLYQKVMEFQATKPDLIVVCIDGNCKRSVQARKEIQQHIGPGIMHRTIVACPDPHVERWYLSDPTTFHSVVGSRPTPGQRKCDRQRYKALLEQAVRDAGHPTTLRGIEFAREIADAMDLFRAGKNESSLRDFIGQARSMIRNL